MKHLKTWELAYFIDTLPKLPRSIHELRLVQAGVPTGYSGRDALRVIKAKTDLSWVVIGTTEDRSSWFNPRLSAVALRVELWHSLTIEAVAVAAHEMGHALQWRKFGASLFFEHRERDVLMHEADAWMRGFHLITKCNLLQDDQIALAKEVAASCWATYTK